MNKPRYQHDCDNCVFIDQYTDNLGSYDMYLCKKEHEQGFDYSEFVLRASDYCSDYYVNNVMAVYRYDMNSVFMTAKNRIFICKYQAALVRALQLGMLDVENLVKQDELLTKYERKN